MRISFTSFKDYSAAFFDGLANLLAGSPKRVQDIFYGLFRIFAKSLYFLPYSYFRKVAKRLSREFKSDDSKVLYYGLIDGLFRMVRWLELLSRGGGQTCDLPVFYYAGGVEETLNQQRGQGAILLMPHSTGSLLTVRELATRYDVLMLIKEPKSAARAERQRRFFSSLGCEILDVRRTDSATVARTIFKALRAGRFVIGTCDRIRSRPPNDLDYHKESDTVLCHIMEQEVGVVGWPARFAQKCRLPMIPLMPTNHVDGICLYIGEPIIAEGNINLDSQAWIDALWQLFGQHTAHWMFAYDKKWAKLLNERNRV